jgi:hypothetical protein
LIDQAGALDIEGTVPFLASVAGEPLPLALTPEQVKSVAKASEPASKGQSDSPNPLDHEVFVRVAAIRGLASLTKGAFSQQARESLLDLVRTGERPIRRQAAIALLLSVPDGQRPRLAEQVGLLLPPADLDVLNVKRRTSPEPASADWARSKKSNPKVGSSLPPTK